MGWGGVGWGGVPARLPAWLAVLTDRPVSMRACLPLWFHLPRPISSSA